MDAQIAVAGLIEEFNALVEGGDFEGAEELLAGAIGASPQFESYFHYQYGRLYSRWNKLTSAANHLEKAAELAHARGDQLFTLQVVEELKQVRKRQASQQP